MKNLPTSARPAMTAGFGESGAIAHNFVRVTSPSNILNSAEVSNLQRGTRSSDGRMRGAGIDGPPLTALQLNFQQAAGVGPGESHKLSVKRGATPRLCNQFHRSVTDSYLTVDFAPESLLRLQIGGTLGASLFPRRRMNEFVLEAPRWPGGPAICEVENLPALETEAELDAFNKANGPSCKVERKWLCPHCEGWHADIIAPDPSGGSSGTGRSSKRSKK